MTFQEHVVRESCNAAALMTNNAELPLMSQLCFALSPHVSVSCQCSQVKLKLVFMYYDVLYVM